MTRYLSVCSGIEAATVAFHPLGWKPLAFSEIEAFPSAVLAHHYPTVPNLGDMTKWKSWDWDILGNTDVLVGGTPCQAFSVAGLRAGLEDERGQLTISYIHLLDHIDEVRSLYGKQPAICVWENVPGVLSSKDNAFGAFLGGLAGENCELIPSGGKWTDAGCVYGPKRSVAWRVLDAQYFGLAQRRKRVFVIASARDIDPSEILFEFDGLRRDTPPSRETGEGSTEAVGGYAENSYSIIADPTPKVGMDVCLTMRSQGGGGGGVVPPSVAVYREGSFGQYNDDGTFATVKASGGVLGGGSESFVTIPIHEESYSYTDADGVEHVTTTTEHLVYPIQQGVNITFCDANGTRADRPDGGLYVSYTDVANGVTTSGTDTKVHAVAIQGSMIGRDDKNGPQGDGLNAEVSFTLNCVDRHAVAFASEFEGYPFENSKGEIINLKYFEDNYIPPIAFHHDAQADQLPTLGGRDTSISDSLTCSQHAAVAFPMDQGGSVMHVEDNMTGTLRRETHGHEPIIAQQMQVRRLTPTECERLQGFPDGYTDVPYRNKPAADGPRYKSLGNSMAVPVMGWIGKRINDAVTRLG